MGIINVTVDTPDIKQSTERMADSMQRLSVGLYVSLAAVLVVWLFVANSGKRRRG